VNEADKSFVLPPALVTHADLARALRELEAIENDLEAQRVRTREKEGAHYRLPSMSRMLSDTLESNNVELGDDQARMGLMTVMRHLKDHAPILHLTFASDADPASLRKLTEWVRGTLHPQALLAIGLQPSLVGGVYVRTPNHVHDFSLRAHLQEKEGIMVRELEKALKGAPQ